MNEPAAARIGEPSSRPTTARDLMLTLLALAAGCVDAASFLGLGQVMTAAMTGNTILLGLALGQADAEGTLRSTVALAGFFAGALLGAAIVERSPRGVIWMPRIMAALALELAVLVILALAWHVLEGRPAWPIDYRHPLIAAAGIAMGIQSAAATRVGVPGVTTTYVTGTLTGMAARLIGWLRSSGAAPDDRSRDGAPWIHAGVWIAYGTGAVCAGAAHLWWPTIFLRSGLVGVAGEIRWGPAALLLPIAIVAVVMLIAAIAYRRHRPPA
jgi:uncharacterized membrane protein YoaK (UPF0700 family)